MINKSTIKEALLIFFISVFIGSCFVVYYLYNQSNTYKAEAEKWRLYWRACAYNHKKELPEDGALLFVDTSLYIVIFFEDSGREGYRIMKPKPKPRMSWHTMETMTDTGQIDIIVDKKQSRAADAVHDSITHIKKKGEKWK
ncbi:MAG: hypothetical protein PVJ60_03985 [Phycisphaerales bacterium]|jgi:hypothetical protein